MNVNQLFPGEFLRAADIKGQRIMVIMEKITMEKVGDDGDKPALHFVGKDKALILNKTNTNMIAYRYGQETDAWMGQQIALHVEPVQFRDKIVDAIRVILPEQAEPAVGQLQGALAAGTAAGPDVGDSFDDDLPF